jgi:hypothetical protein
LSSPSITTLERSASRISAATARAENQSRRCLTAG